MAISQTYLIWPFGFTAPALGVAEGPLLPLSVFTRFPPAPAPAAAAVTASFARATDVAAVPDGLLFLPLPLLVALWFKVPFGVAERAAAAAGEDDGGELRLCFFALFVLWEASKSLLLSSDKELSSEDSASYWWRRTGPEKK